LPDIDLVVNAVVGSVGLAPTLAALNSNKAVALANKESLAVGSGLIRDALLTARARSCLLTPSITRCTDAWVNAPSKKSLDSSSQRLEGHFFEPNQRILLE